MIERTVYSYSYRDMGAYRSREGWIKGEVAGGDMRIDTRRNNVY
jgi:hypothetical protein